MTEREFTELRDYAEAFGRNGAGAACIDKGHRPLDSLIRKRWLTEVVPGCWSITLDGAAAFFDVVDGRTSLR